MPVTPQPIQVYPKSIADLDRLFRTFSVSTDPNTIGPTELMADAVTTPKVADAAVTTAKVADSAVTTIKIGDEAVTITKLAAPVADDVFLVKRIGGLDYGPIVETDIPATIARVAAYIAADGVVAANAASALSSAITSLNLASGVYTPTRSAEANLDSNVTFSQAQYLMVGSVVTVSGRFTADPTLTATTTSFEGTLPIASNVGAAEDVAGTAFCGNIVSQGAEIIGVAANDTFKVQWKAGDITSQTWSYSFTYRII